VILPKYASEPKAAFIRAKHSPFPPRYNAGLPAGISVIDYEFTADQCKRPLHLCVHIVKKIIIMHVCVPVCSCCLLAATFSCDDSCPGTYNMKLSVCELECDDSKHAGHAGTCAATAAAAAAVVAILST
jgi:hypothetical protein